MWTRGSNTLRSVNVNAPVDGVRPDPGAGNISEIQSSGTPRERSPHRGGQRAARAAAPLHERDVPAPELAQLRRLGDEPALDSTNPDLDWGPSAQDIRHRLFLMFNAPIWKGVRAGLNMQVASARHNITTGRDDNLDTVFNDRPAGMDATAHAGPTR